MNSSVARLYRLVTHAGFSASHFGWKLAICVFRGFPRLETFFNGGPIKLFPGKCRIGVFHGSFHQ